VLYTVVDCLTPINSPAHIGRGVYALRRVGRR
jgi:hypothetical protein